MQFIDILLYFYSKISIGLSHRNIMALGRGLGELLGEIGTAYQNDSKVVTSKNTVLELDVELIKPNPHQPRKIFNQEKLKELSSSIINNGLLQPIVVTRDGGNYLLIAGERRLRATKLANIPKIKAIIVEVKDSKLRELALIENIQRDDLNIMEIAYSYAGLLNDYKITQEELSKIVSKSRSSIANTVRLLSLSKDTKEKISLNQITQGHAKLIIGMSDEQQKLMVNSIIGQKLSVKDTEVLVKQLKDENKAPQESQRTTISEKTTYDFNKLQDIKNRVKKDNLDIKFDKDYFKIKINSQEDIEKIAKYFS
ncbi:MAG: ParB/RepB/Spo0J family partition protein [Campylobacterota bacterium]|nr:ParB/RepB/Spo0J family partition protein [Campylobacterota bacterium]